MDYVLGAGKVYVAYNNDPSYGDRYLGNSPGLSFTPTVETMDVYDTINGVVERTESHITRFTASSALLLDDINLKNLQMFMMSEASEIVASSALFEKTIRLVPGNAYDLGAQAVRDLAVSYGLDTLPLEYFVLDSAAGLLFVKDQADIYLGQEVSLSYTGNGMSYTGMTGKLSPYSGRMRFVEDNIAGPNRVLLCPSVVLYPDSDLDLKASNWRTLRFRVEILSRPLWVDKRLEDDYSVGVETEDFGDLSSDNPTFTDDYGVL